MMLEFNGAGLFLPLKLLEQPCRHDVLHGMFGTVRRNTYARLYTKDINGLGGFGFHHTATLTKVVDVYGSTSSLSHRLLHMGGP